MRGKFYITTAIDYVNGDPHIGHAMEKIEADVLARWHRLKGADVFFLGGTDENAQKNVLAAEEAGESVKNFVEENARKFQKMGDLLDISFDGFRRTSDKKKHWPGVKKLWKRCAETGDIYKKKYEGLYCVGCEAFVTEKDLVDGKCPEHLREPEKVAEENYFFRLSKYEKSLISLIESDKLHIVPEKRKKEVLNFIKSGLEDLSASRPKERLKGWGVPVPGDEDQIIYVWMDALASYITALGYGSDEKLFSKYWPADLHVIGKGILRFHAVYWPAFLVSAGIKLPKRIFVHDYVTVNGQKMSKTIGNVINPIDLVEKFGTDAVRYYFLREISPFRDGDFTYDRFKERYNADLANGVGNLLSRVLTLVLKNLEEEFEAEPDKEFETLFKKVEKEVEEAVASYKLHEALASIWEIVNYADTYVDRKKPWETGDKDVLRNLTACLVEIGFLLRPFLPETSRRIADSLGLEGGWKVRPSKCGPLFPRID